MKPSVHQSRHEKGRIFAPFFCQRTMQHFHPSAVCKRGPVITVLLVGIFLSCTTLAQDTGGRRGGRIAPPAVITCDRNQLTSWTGEVTGYRRDEKASWLEISTDENTVEETTIDHDGSTDTSAHYLLWGEPFTQADWTAIESAPGQLIEGMRATAWICLDGKTSPVIDWQPHRD